MQIDILKRFLRFDPGSRRVRVRVEPHQTLAGQKDYVITQFALGFAPAAERSVIEYNSIQQQRQERRFFAMHYLNLSTRKIIFACFAFSSLLLARFPNVDIRVSKLFFDDGFYLGNQWWVALLNGGLTYCLFAGMLVVVGIYAFNLFAKRNVFGIDGRKILYLFLVLILGAGLIVNVIFKDNFGRVRPRDLEEFGGSSHFTPAFVVTGECERNCSFSSGHGAGGFFAVALALALSRRRAVLLAALAFGGAVSFARIASGAHFFSDSVVSFFVMVLVADIFYYFMFVEREQNPARS